MANILVPDLKAARPGLPAESGGHGLCRRMTVPLDGSSQQATIAPLMKDDGYTFCELPRVNPKNKVFFYSLVL